MHVYYVFGLLSKKQENLNRNNYIRLSSESVGVFDFEIIFRSSNQCFFWSPVSLTFSQHPNRGVKICYIFEWWVLCDRALAT